jgi:hypothetical protein
MPPPILAYIITPAQVDIWRGKWNNYLEASGVSSIADDAAREARARSLLTLALDEDVSHWLRTQEWADDPAIKRMADLVLDRYKIWAGGHFRTN